jgi:hypothetical protein
MRITIENLGADFLEAYQREKHHLCSDLARRYFMRIVGPQHFSRVGANLSFTPGFRPAQIQVNGIDLSKAAVDLDIYKFCRYYRGMMDQHGDAWPKPLHIKDKAEREDGGNFEVGSL